MIIINARLKKIIKPPLGVLFGTTEHVLFLKTELKS